MSASPWDNVLRQLVHQPGGLNLSVNRYNPRPSGVIRNGSSTHLVLELLQGNQDRYFNHAAITWQTKCTAKAVNWALLFLKSQGLIECGSDPRNERYARYKFTGSKNVQAQISEAPKTRGVSIQSDAPSSPGAQTQGLPAIRGARHSDLPAVAAQLAAVHPGYGAGTESGALVGPHGRKAGLHAGKRDLDPANATKASESVLPQGDLVGNDAHTNGVGAKARNAAKPLVEQDLPRYGPGARDAPGEIPGLQATIFHQPKDSETGVTT